MNRERLLNKLREYPWFERVEGVAMDKMDIYCKYYPLDEDVELTREFHSIGINIAFHSHEN